MQRREIENWTARINVGALQAVVVSLRRWSHSFTYNCFHLHLEALISIGLYPLFKGLNTLTALNNLVHIVLTLRGVHYFLSIARPYSE